LRSELLHLFWQKVWRRTPSKTLIERAADTVELTLCLKTTVAHSKREKGDLNWLPILISRG
jgi:hypothetical protein